MTFEEKKQILKAHKKEKNYFYGILVLIGINFIYGLIMSILKFGDMNFSSKADFPGSGFLPSSMVIITLILMLGLQVLYFFSIWRLQGWVTLFMWIGFIGSILSFDLVNIIITGVILFGYKKVLKLFKTAALPQANPQA